MDVQAIADWLRISNALMGLAAFVLLIARVLSVWKRWSYSQKMVFGAILCYVTGMSYGSIELLVSHFPFSWRVVLISVGHILLLIYLAEPERRYRSRLGMDLRGCAYCKRK